MRDPWQEDDGDQTPPRTRPEADYEPDGYDTPANPGLGRMMTADGLGTMAYRQSGYLKASQTEMVALAAASDWIGQ